MAAAERPGGAGQTLMSLFDAIAGCRPCDAIDRSKKRPSAGGRSPWTEKLTGAGNSPPSQDAAGGREAGGLGRPLGGHAYGVPVPASRELPTPAQRVVVSPVRAVDLPHGAYVGPPAARAESDYIAFGPQDVGGDLTCYGQPHDAWPHHAQGANGHGALGGQASALGLLSDFDHILAAPWPEVCQCIACCGATSARLMAVLWSMECVLCVLFPVRLRAESHFFPAAHAGFCPVPRTPPRAAQESNGGAVASDAFGHTDSVFKYDAVASNHSHGAFRMGSGPGAFRSAGAALPTNFAPPGTEPGLAVIDKRGDFVAVSGSGHTIAAQRNPFGSADTYEQAEPVTRTGAIMEETTDRRTDTASPLHFPASVPENSPQATPHTTPQIQPNATPQPLQPKDREHSASERPAWSRSSGGQQRANSSRPSPPSERTFLPVPRARSKGRADEYEPAQ